MNKHIQLKKDGEHKGYVHKGLYSALKDLEPIYGKEVYKSLGKIVKHKHGEGKYNIGDVDIPENDIDSSEILEVLSSLVNNLPEVKKKGTKKVKEIEPSVVVTSENEPSVKVEGTGVMKKQPIVGIQKWKIS
jgi:hypothetical protein